MNTLQAEDTKLLKMLRKGARNARSSYELADRLGVSQRSIGFSVSRLRRNGHAVGSIHGEGYYIISNGDELQSTIEHIARRKAGIDRTIKSLEDAYHGTPSSI